MRSLKYKDSRQPPSKYSLHFGSCQPMKQISEVEEKPFTSSLNICLKACFRKRVGTGGVTPPLPSASPYFPADPSIFHSRRRNRYLLLGVSFILSPCTELEFLNRVGIGLSYRPARGGIFKLLWSPEIDSKASILPAYVA